MSKDEKILNLILLNVGRAVHHADWNYKNVQSPFARIYMVKEGKASLCMPDGVYELKKGYLYLVPSFTLHSYICNDYFVLNYIHVYEDQSAGFSIMELLNLPVVTDSGLLETMLIERLLAINPGRELAKYDPSLYDNESGLIQNVARNAQQPLYLKTETAGILLQLFSLFIAKSSSKIIITDDRIKKSISYIRKNIKSPISTQQLSKICYLSEDHFIRLFKEEIKCTPLQYIIHKKIEHAQLLLTISNSSIKDICYSLSFGNVSYFNRVFKSLTGLTPAQYRNKIRLE